jgi:hypothetical protein
LERLAAARQGLHQEEMEGMGVLLLPPSNASYSQQGTEQMANMLMEVMASRERTQVVPPGMVERLWS